MPLFSYLIFFGCIASFFFAPVYAAEVNYGSGTYGAALYSGVSTGEDEESSGNVSGSRARDPIGVPVITVATSTPYVRTVAPQVSSYYFSRNLQLHDTGEDVRELQKFLNTHTFTIATTGPGSPGFETTRFGGLTKAALIRYQVTHGISPAVGFFGPVTRGFVNSQRASTAPTVTRARLFTRDLMIGSTGGDVFQLQKFLNSHGFVLIQTGPGSPGNETSLFGSLTRAALIRFQEKYNIFPAQGYLNLETRNMVEELMGKVIQ